MVIDINLFAHTASNATTTQIKEITVVNGQNGFYTLIEIVILVGFDI